MLISVQNSFEARTAAGHSLVTIVDLKDPSRGSLGFAGPKVANEVIGVVTETNPDKQISLACGELHQWRLDSENLEAEFDISDLEDIQWSAVSFVKVGLSGNFAATQDLDRLKRFFAIVPNHVRRVLAVYVDLFSMEQAGELIREADTIGASVLLLDTFEKSHGDLFAYVTADQCQAIFRQAKAQNMTNVLAGSINIASLHQAAETGADLLGVRGAVCQQDDSSAGETRKNSLCRHRLDQFLEATRVILEEAPPVS